MNVPIADKIDDVISAVLDKNDAGDLYGAVGVEESRKGISKRRLHRL